MIPPAGEILTNKDIAGYLKSSERMINRFAAAGSIQSFKREGAWRLTTAGIKHGIDHQMRQVALGIEVAGETPSRGRA